jgi:hypothetical protein
MDKFAQRLLIAILFLGSGCGTNSLSFGAGRALKIAVAYNFVPEEATPKTLYGGNNTLEVFVDPQVASLIRADFFDQAATENKYEFIAVQGQAAQGEAICPTGANLVPQVEALGADLLLCVDRSFYYNDVTGAAMVTTRVGVFSADGDVLWRGSSTTGLGFRSLRSTKDIFSQTRKAALRSNKEAAKDLRRALASLN